MVARKIVRALVLQLQGTSHIASASVFQASRLGSDDKLTLRDRIKLP